jgi:hypothetical protein
MILNDLLVGYSTGGFVTGLGKIFLKFERRGKSMAYKNSPPCCLGRQHGGETLTESGVGR